MAARFAYTHADLVSGLALWASFPAATDDLSGRELQVLTIYASEDLLATPSEVEASRGLLPPDTIWQLITGGNHAQFGWYGPQPGDGEAAIPREAQQAQVVAATLSLLAVLADGFD